LLVLGCGAGGSFTPAEGAPQRAARSPQSVEVVANAGPEHVELGQIKAASGVHPPTGDGKDEVLAQLKEIAGEHGCEAIVVNEPEEDLYATSNGTPLYKTHQRARCFAKR
jgi:hypothetical protein